MMKRYEEISSSEALQKKYKYGRVPIINYEKNETEYEYVLFILLK